MLSPGYEERVHERRHDEKRKIQAIQRRVVRLARQRDERRQEDEPQRMRERLHPLRNVPAQPETVQKVVNRAERDICVVADPRGSDQHDGDQEERDDEQNPLFDRKLRGDATIARRKVPDHFAAGAPAAFIKRVNHNSRRTECVCDGR